MRIDALESREGSVQRDALSFRNEQFLKWAHKFLLANGWARTDYRRQSAMFNKMYERGQRMVGLSGWHGTGTGVRNFGNLKLLFAIADNHPGGKGPREIYPKEQLTLDIVNGTVEDADRFLLTAKEYILALK